MIRLSEALGEHVQIPVEEGTGVVAAGLDIRGVGATPQGRGHLLGRLDERIPYDFEFNRIVHVSSVSSIRW